MTNRVMTRSRLVLLDANIVIQVHRMGIWEELCARYEIARTEAVRDKSKYFERDDGVQERIELDADIEAGTGKDSGASSLLDLWPFTPS